MKKIYVPLVVATAALFALTACSTPTVNTDPEPAEEVGVETATPVEAEEEAPSEPGMRDNPAPIGSEVSDGDWTVKVNSVNLDATEEILNHNEFNEAPGEGEKYIMVNATITYTGTNPQGEVPYALMDYVTADGNTINLSWVDYEDTDFTVIDPLYEGASHTGSNAYLVPADTAADGTLAVTPGMMSERVFFAVQ